MGVVEVAAALAVKNPTTGGNGSMITTVDGSTFMYVNNFGGVLGRRPQRSFQRQRSMQFVDSTAQHLLDLGHEQGQRVSLLCLFRVSFRISLVAVFVPVLEPLTRRLLVKTAQSRAGS